MAIKFKKHWKIYNPGEIASFEEEIEQKLIDNDVAEKIIESDEKSFEAPKDKMVRSPKAKK
jgi:hypothetical protein